MNRLTKRIGENVYANNINRDTYTNNEDLEQACIDKTNEIYTKLGQLEDIEDELGIDLITLFKALKNGIYVNDGASIVFYPSRELRLGYDTHYGKGDELCILKDCNYAGNTKLVSLTNYSKNWSLDKNELITA